MQEKLESPSKEELMDTKSVQDQNMDFEIHVTKTIGQNRVIAQEPPQEEKEEDQTSMEKMKARLEEIASTFSMEMEDLNRFFQMASCDFSVLE